MKEMQTYKLQDLIDIPQFQGLQDRLNEIYSFPSAIIDNDGNILTATAWQDVCTVFHRKHGECLKECIKSDQYILDHMAEASPAVSYRCPHGLVDNATPIIIDGVHYGNFFTGQFFLEPPDLDFFREQARRYGFDEAAYLKAVERVPVWSQKQLESYLFFIKGLIEVITSSGMKNLKEIAARKTIEENEERAAVILNQIQDGFWIATCQGGRIKDANPAMCQMVGYPYEELLTKTIADVEAQDTSSDIEQRIRQIVRDGSASFESRFRRKDGTLIDVEVSVTYLQSADLMFGFHRDVSERKQAEAALRQSQALLKRINRELRAISDCNQTLVRAQDEHTLLQDICRIVCDEAGYRMAWVGYAEDGPDQTIQPVAWAGFETCCIENDAIAWIDTQCGEGPTGTAIRTGQTQCVQDIQTDPRAALWRACATQCGYRSGIILPLPEENGTIFGSLNIYSDEPNAFTSDETRLLEELAGDLAFGISVLRARARRERAELALQESEMRFRSLVEQSADGVALTDEQGLIIEWNRAQASITGISSEQAIGKPVWDLQYQLLVPERQSKPWLERMRGVVQMALCTGVSRQFGSSIELDIQPASGARKTILQTSFPVKMAAGYRIGSIMRDVTEQKQSAEALRRSEAKFRAVVENSNDGILFVDAGAVISYRSPSVQRLTGTSDGEGLGRSSFELVQPEDMEMVNQYWARVVQNPGVPLKVEYRMRHKDGTCLWAETTANNLIDNPDVRAIVINSRDITERKQREQDLQIIALLSAALRTASTRAEMLPVIARQMLNLLHCDAGVVEMIDPASGEVIVEAGEGLWTSLVGHHRPKGVGLNAILCQTLRPYHTNNLAQDPNRPDPAFLAEGIYGSVGVPLIAQEMLIGFLWAGRKGDMSEMEVRLLTAIAEIAGNAIHRATLHEQTQKHAVDLARAYDATLEGLARALELRDQETEGHSWRVVERTLHLAQALGVSETNLENIRRGALLHDIGKMGIPDSILLKPGPLDEREWETMRQHPIYSFNLLKQIEYLRPALDIPYCHHEKWDGSGYPRGLKGEQIPLEARIFAIIDVWDALTNDRPYRPAWAAQEALQYIRQQSGKHFDPHVVEAFLAVTGSGTL